MVWEYSSTDDGCFTAPVLAQDKSQGRKELNVLSVLRSGAEGTDPLDLHLADLRHFTVRRLRFALSTLYLEIVVRKKQRRLAENNVLYFMVQLQTK